MAGKHKLGTRFVVGGQKIQIKGKSEETQIRAGVAKCKVRTKAGAP